MEQNIPQSAKAGKTGNAPTVPLLAVQIPPAGEEEGRKDFFVEFEREMMAVEIAVYLDEVLGLEVATCEHFPFLPGGVRGKSKFYVRCFCLPAHMTEAYNFALNVCIEFDRALVDAGLQKPSKYGPDFAPAKDYR